ncbi:MAG: sodium:proton antiporter [Deltaproteobacteria bacterium]|jgi:Na+/H+ antiporter NhaD/arsenite permease-like protein|nr:sodium:proton antiporter [Deltaproteobacteria bacterium]
MIRSAKKERAGGNSLCKVSAFKVFKRAVGFFSAALVLSALLFPGTELWASGGGVPRLDGSSISIFWIAPFLGMLLSIALFPLFAPGFWEKNYGKVAALWAAFFLCPAFFLLGAPVTLYSLVHTLAEEYLPFIILLFALFTIAGGIVLTGSLSGTPALNVGFLALGALLASFMGTTGAAMLLIRPLIRGIKRRGHKTHSVIFFIFLVANAGGSLTPLGDPPLFLGFLKGVRFSWTIIHLWPQTLFLCGILLGLYYLIDRHLFKKEGSPKGEGGESLKLSGKYNFLLLGAVAGLVLYSGIAKSPEGIRIWGDVFIPRSNLVKDLGLLLLAFLSFLITPKALRDRNHFTWGPILEVAKLFLGIFVTMIPAIAILRAGEDGALKPLIGLVTSPLGEPRDAVYFWMTGLLSSFLDNAPTYLVFFNTAGGDARYLMDVAPLTLSAISCGAVYMGANTYIGNAPNFIVRSIAEERGVAMPSFFGYMAWSSLILLPLFVMITFIFY